MIVEFRPALRIEAFFEQLWGGKLTRWDFPGPRLAAEIAREGYLEEEIVLATVPLPLQRGLERLLAAIGRRLDDSPARRP